MKKFAAALAIVAGSAAAVVGSALPAFADATFTINVWEGSGNPTGPFGTVKLVQNGANVDVTVTPALNMGFVDTGSHEALDFVVNSSTLTMVLPTGWTSPNTHGTITTVAGLSTGTYNSGTFSYGGVGTFKYALDCDTATCGNGGNHPDKSPLLFTVDNVLVSDFTSTNGFYFIADVCSAVNVDGACSGNTGPAASNTPPTITTNSVPEPLTLSMFGAGLAGAAFIRRRGKKAA